MHKYVFSQMYKFLTFFLAYKELHQYLSISKYEGKKIVASQVILLIHPVFFLKIISVKKKCLPKTCFLSG